jgi:hypothetical protein
VFGISNGVHDYKTSADGALAAVLVSTANGLDSDTTAHSVQIVTVAENVKLEVLDWGARDGLWFC